MSARFETLHADVVDRIVATVARTTYVDDNIDDPHERESRGKTFDSSDVMRDVMANLVRPTIEHTLAALRALAYAPDGFCLLDGMAQATVAQERKAATTTWSTEHRKMVSTQPPPDSPTWYGTDLAPGQAVVDLVLDRLALLPPDPRPR